MRRWTFALVGLSALAVLSACSTPGGERLGACVAQAGITGEHSVTTTLRNGRTERIVLPGPNVTQAQADRANACIAQAPVSSPVQASAPASPTLGQTTVIQSDGTITRESFTTGTPAGVPIPSVEPPQSAPAVSPAQPLASVSCPMELSGGSGYACAR